MFTISDQEYRQLSAFIEKHTGIHLGPRKKSLVQSRLQQTLEKRKLETFDQYYVFLTNDSTGAAMKELTEKLTTNHTYFMRERDHFAYLQHHVLPYLEKSVSSKDLRIWSAGCSYGQEPYTIAMILDDYFGANKFAWDTKVLATDISPRVIEEAKLGVYKNEDVLQLPERWRSKHFQAYDGERTAVKQHIKQEVLYRPLNLIHPFPFRQPFHVIFCRNVMIYFDEHVRADLLRRFYNSLLPGGYLFIGHSESLQREETSFRYVMPAVYRK
ncbi:CheR family methyltransferase [Paenibacillus alkalitolerans]|uniref:CheR family methyltransferase n=1 Tax=Paenibacillus alkalitolerans TaxID=2799335 RepID=UPI0018F666B4|nr:protein-glutamate O-methyltransferase CheR [Paenibacillus alkalitolerans]